MREKEILCAWLVAISVAMKCKVFSTKKREKETNLYAFGVVEAV